MRQICQITLITLALFHGNSFPSSLTLSISFHMIDQPRRRRHVTKNKKTITIEQVTPLHVGCHTQSEHNNQREFRSRKIRILYITTKNRWQLKNTEIRARDKPFRGGLTEFLDEPRSLNLSKTYVICLIWFKACEIELQTSLDLQLQLNKRRSIISL